jgi:hypothetical protein
MNTPLNFQTLLAGVLVSLLSFAAGCTTTPPTLPNYSVTCRKSASFETGKPSGYDPEFGGYWLAGSSATGATISLTPRANQNAPGGDLVLSLRTTTDPRSKSNLSFLRLLTPQYSITARSQEPGVLSIESSSDPSHLQILRDTDYLRISLEGNRIKIVLTDEFLRRYAPSGAALTWFDTAPGAILFHSP